MDADMCEAAMHDSMFSNVFIDQLSNTFQQRQQQKSGETLEEKSVSSKLT